MSDIRSVIDQVGSAHVFPIILGDAPGTFGLTKHELFAAMAMQGLLGDPECTPNREHVAAAAIEFADALLKKLAK